jgi:hypothetical protein
MDWKDATRALFPASREILTVNTGDDFDGDWYS